MRAAAESEDVDRIARLVVRDQEAIGVVDIRSQPVAERAAPDAVSKVARSDALIVVDDLQRAVLIFLHRRQAILRTLVT